jgi:NAD(P)-dependent dehydrogenase (short-subunit alcohol dehydrogenase family)
MVWIGPLAGNRAAVRPPRPPRHAAGKLQPTAQIARATAFLCSDAADSMTGSVLLIDGGCSLFEFAEDEA